MFFFLSIYHFAQFFQTLATFGATGWIFVTENNEVLSSFVFALGGSGPFFGVTLV